MDTVSVVVFSLIGLAAFGIERLFSTDQADRRGRRSDNSGGHDGPLG